MSWSVQRNLQSSNSFVCIQFSNSGHSGICEICETLQACSQAFKQFLPGQPAEITAEDAKVNGARLLGTGCLSGLAFGLGASGQGDEGKWVE